MLLADKEVNLQSLPDRALWVLAIVGVAFFAAVVLRTLPPPVRRGSGGRSVVSAIPIFLVGAGISHDQRLVLWCGAVGFLTASLPLLWMGRMPADMPGARDPAVKLHPRYEEVARRGRIAGVGIVVLSTAVVVLSVVFVRGI